MFKILVSGDSSDAVWSLKYLLAENGFTIYESDKHSTLYSAKFVNMVKTFQNENGIEPTGTVNHQTWTKLMQTPHHVRHIAFAIDIPPTSRVHDDVPSIYKRYSSLINRLCRIYGIELAAFLAIVRVETTGSGFDPQTHKLLLRFEVHKFWEVWGKENRAEFYRKFKFNQEFPWKEHKYCPYSNPAGVWKDVHASQFTEHEAFNLAKDCVKFGSINPVYECASYGLPQIMGFNHDLVGFKTAKDLYEYMNKTEKHQLYVFFDFIQRNEYLVKAIRDKNWFRFAKIYNGPGQPEWYAERLEKFYNQYKNILTV